MTTENCHSSDLTSPCAEATTKTQPSLLSLALLPARAIAASLSGAADVFRKTFDGEYSDTCSICCKAHAKHEDCCEIPESRCPSPCVCKIHWTGCPGDTVHYQIQVTNTGKIKRDFKLSALPFSCTSESLKVSPDKKSLQPAESLKATASFTIPTTFGGGIYQTRIIVAGAYEQYILVHLTVKPHQHCCCEIEQGEIPKRTKAHHWYHHFQCEEPCFEAISQETSPRVNPADNRSREDN